MIFETAEQILGNCPIRFLSRHDPALELRCLLRLDESLPFYPDHILFFGDCTSLKNARNIPREGNSLLLYLNEKDPSPALWYGFANVLGIENAADYQECLSKIQENLKAEGALIEGNRKLLQLLVSDRPIQEIINHVAATFGHYASILDNALNILAMADNILPPETGITREHENRMILPDTMRYHRLHGNLERMRNVKVPIRITNDPQNAYCYSVPIIMGKNLVTGFLQLFVKKEEQLSPLLLFYMRETASQLAFLMQKNTINTTNKVTFFTSLLYSMLQGHPAPDAASYRERFLVFHYQLKRYKRICVVRLQNLLSIGTDAEALASTIQTLLPNSIYVIYDHDLVFLTSENTVTSIRSLDNLYLFLKNSMLKMGVSDIFEEEDQAQNYFVTARAALRLGEKADPQLSLYRYRDYFTTDMIDILAESRDLKPICYQPLLRLFREDSHDEKHMLMDTLYWYLTFSQSVQKTCDALFIHRNTLYYRLQKIRDIMGRDFTSAPTVTAIFITLRILEYMNLYRIPRTGDSAGHL